MNVTGPILVSLDGSELAERALPLVADLARRAGAEIQLVHVHLPVTADPIHMEGLPVVDEQLHSLRRDHERAYLEKVRQRLGPAAKVSAVLLDGPVAATLAAHAQGTNAWLVVMTTHGRGGLERAWLGSVADALVRVSLVPLLLVRPEPAGTPAALARVLVALDGSETSDAIVDHAARLARVVGAEMLVLQVVQPLAAAVWVPEAVVTSGAVDEDLADREEKSAREHLDGVARRIGAEGVRVRVHVARGIAVAPAILEVARAERVDLVALATHGRSGLARVALGSVADKVLRASPVPVLLFRPQPA